LPRIVVGEEDQDYIEQLINRGIVDREFVEDVLAVDMTRAVFSDDRCNLLSQVPGVPVDELNAESLRAAILDKLGTPTEGTPEAELANNLANPRDDLGARAATFTQACNARMSDLQEISFEKDGQSQTREVPSMLIDYMKIISLNREQARRMSVFEFPQTMPSDNQGVASGTRLHPETCQITTEFVAVAPTFDPASSCFGRCGETTPGGCSCADDCEGNGGCCSDFADECVIPECAHDICQEGVSLVSKCQDTTNFPGDECVKKICDQDTFCCDSEWDSNCVDEVETVCGLACPAEQECCKLCQSGQACGDSCIPADAVCDAPAGCACDA
jgi:hypothetical protein